MLYAESTAKLPPDVAAKLRVSVGGDGCWHAEAGDPPTDDGIGAFGSCDGLQRDSCLYLSGDSFNNSEQIPKPA